MPRRQQTGLVAKVMTDADKLRDWIAGLKSIEQQLGTGGEDFQGAGVMVEETRQAGERLYDKMLDLAGAILKADKEKSKAREDIDTQAETLGIEKPQARKQAVPKQQPPDDTSEGQSPMLDRPGTGQSAR